MSSFGVALVASLALSAIGVASASAAQHWYVGGTKLAEGTPTAITMKGTTGYTLKWNWSGIPFTINCSSQSAEGTIENPAGGAAGTTNLGNSFRLSGCTVKEPLGQGCKIKGGQMLPTSVHGEAIGSNSVSLWSESGVFFHPVFEGCKTQAFNSANYDITGSITGTLNSANSSLEFTKTSSALYVLGGIPVTFEGTSKLETTTGKTVTVGL